MTKQNLIKKFTSRKFLTALAAELAGILTLILGADHPVAIAAGAVLTVAAAAVYCIMEGRIDAASVKTVTDAVSDAAEGLGYDQVAETVDDVGEVVVKGFCVSDETEDIEKPTER